MEKSTEKNCWMILTARSNYMLTIEQISSIAEEYETPAYIFDIEELSKRIQSIRKITGEEIELCFAMKANPFLVHYIEPLVDRLEVCSPGEFAICEREKVNMNNVVLSGVYKNKNDIEYTMRMEYNIGLYTVESMAQWEILSDSVKQSQKKISVLLRLTNGNQFGLDATDINTIISNRNDYPYIMIKGIQYFSGTQKKNMEQIAKEIEELDNTCSHLLDEYNFQAEEIEYGPGLPVDYFSAEAANQNLNKFEQLMDLLKPIKSKYKIAVELGRYFTATCGIYLSKVVDIKANKGLGYCIIDGGIHHINYYGQMLALKFPVVDIIKSAHENSHSDIKEWTICGSLCTVNDVLMRKYPITNPDVGDVFVFYNTGAYSVTETGYLFLSREMPLILAVNNDGKEEKINILRDRIKTDVLNSRQQVCNIKEITR